jgi:hypothetical protein
MKAGAGQDRSRWAPEGNCADDEAAHARLALDRLEGTDAGAFQQRRARRQTAPAVVSEAPRRLSLADLKAAALARPAPHTG